MPLPKMDLRGLPPLPAPRGSRAPRTSLDAIAPAAVQTLDRKEQLRLAHPAFAPPPGPTGMPLPAGGDTPGGLQLDPSLMPELPPPAPAPNAPWNPANAAQALNSRAVEQVSGRAFGLRPPALDALSAEPDPVTESESRAWRTRQAAQALGVDLTNEKSIPLVQSIYGKEGEVDPVVSALREQRRLEAQARTEKLTRENSPENQAQVARERNAKIDNLVAAAAAHGVHLSRDKLALENDPQRLQDLHNSIASLSQYRTDETTDRRASLELRRRDLAAAWEQRAEKEARDAGQQVDKRAESADEFLAKHPDVLEAANPEGFFARWGRRLTGGGLSPADQARAALAEREAARGAAAPGAAPGGANPFAAPIVLPQGGAQPTQIFSSAAPPGPAVTPAGPSLGAPPPDPKKVAQFQWVAKNHPDPATRQRAAQRLAQWGIQ